MKYLVILLCLLVQVVYGELVEVKEVSGLPGRMDEVIAMYQEPVVVRGYGSDWGAMSWSPEYFCREYGDEEIVHYPEWDAHIEKWLDDGSYDFFMGGRVLAPVQKHCERVKGDGDYRGYVADGEFLSMRPELMEQISLPNDDCPLVAMFMGNNTRSGMHTHERFTSLVTMISGKKVVTFLAPEDCGAIECFRDQAEEMDAHYVSAIDFDNALYEALPVKVYQAELNPGDAVFIPRRWFHDVRSIGEAISLSKFVFIPPGG